jgi:hypothetical protein
MMNGDDPILYTPLSMPRMIADFRAYLLMKPTEFAGAKKYIRKET